MHVGDCLLGEVPGAGAPSRLEGAPEGEAGLAVVLDDGGYRIGHITKALRLEGGEGGWVKDIVSKAWNSLQ
jgi:hypothetical protein